MNQNFKTHLAKKTEKQTKFKKIKKTDPIFAMTDFALSAKVPLRDGTEKTSHNRKSIVLVITDKRSFQETFKISRIREVSVSLALITKCCHAASFLSRNT